MKVLLANDVKNLGQAGDMVTVKDGYARNYLLPKGLALNPTAGNVKRVEEEKKKRDADQAARQQRLGAAKAALEGVAVTVKAKANEEGHLFGSVTEAEIGAALRKLGHQVVDAQILLAEPIRQLDRFHVPVRLAEGFEATIDLWVVPEEA